MEERLMRERLLRSEAERDSLGEQVSLLEERHRDVVANLEAQLTAMARDRDNLARRLFEAEEHQRITDAELQLLRRMHGSLSRGYGDTGTISETAIYARAPG